jgi:hypothetical protein
VLRPIPKLNLLRPARRGCAFAGAMGLIWTPLWNATSLDESAIDVMLTNPKPDVLVGQLTAKARYFSVTRADQISCPLRSPSLLNCREGWCGLFLSKANCLSTLARMLAGRAR